MTDRPVFLDANILLEIILGRENEPVAREFLSTQRGELVISALTAHLIVHFGLTRVPIAVLQTFLADYTIVSLEQADFDWAFANVRDDDFEDALQLSCALNAGCYSFVTFDRNLHRAYNEHLANLGVVLLKQ